VRFLFSRITRAFTNRVFAETERFESQLTEYYYERFDMYGLESEPSTTPDSRAISPIDSGAYSLPKEPSRSAPPTTRDYSPSVRLRRHGSEGRKPSRKKGQGTVKTQVMAREEEEGYASWGEADTPPPEPQKIRVKVNPLARYSGSSELTWATCSFTIGMTSEAWRCRTTLLLMNLFSW
jgi:hypothetical protein